MAISYIGMQQLLANSVVELAFIRRNEKAGWPSNRRMLCTNSVSLLSSLAGRMALNFRVPTQPPPYNAKDKNLFITWDIFMQNYRALPLESVIVVNAIPVSNQKEIDLFWEYFDKALRPMSSNDKTQFMKK